MNPENIFAYLISVQEYTEDDQLHELSQTSNNVTSLHKIFRSNKVGIPGKTNIKAEFNPTDSKKIIKDIRALISAPEAKTLIVYYAGHGVLDDDGTHYLTLSDSTVDDIDLDGFSIDDLSQAWAKKKNVNVILILDSCFSENAFDNFKARNFLVLASSAKNRTSKYPVDADYSAFTNELITVLENGLDIESENLTWKDVYTELKKNLKEKGFPAPKIAAQNEVESQIIAINSFHKDEVSMDDLWVKVIKEDMGKNNPKFKEKVIGILNSGSAQTINKLKEHLLNSFPYPIAYYLNKVFEKDPGPEVFIELYESTVRFLFMVSFIHYESVKQSKKLKSVDEIKGLMLNFDEPDHELYMSLLAALDKVFKANKVGHFLSEFDFASKDFQDIIQKLEKLRSDKEPNMGTIKNTIFQLIAKLDFLLNYNLVSIKDVNLSFRKYDEIAYNHSVSILQGIGHTSYEVWDEVSEYWQHAFVHHPTAKNNRSVLFLRCSDPENLTYLNLWPMVIDKNVLEPKATTPMIFLYAGKDGQDNYLYQNIRETEVIGMKTYSELEAFAASGKIEKFNELLVK